MLDRFLDRVYTGVEVRVWALNQDSHLSSTLASVVLERRKGESRSSTEAAATEAAVRRVAASGQPPLCYVASRQMWPFSAEAPPSSKSGVFLLLRMDVP